MAPIIAHAPPDDDWWDEDEHETYTCQWCGRQEERPAIVIFAGKGEATTATEVCSVCVGAVRVGL